MSNTQLNDLKSPIILCSIFIIILSQLCSCEDTKKETVSSKFSTIHGPGLSPNKIRLPCQYFFVNLKNQFNKSITDRSIGSSLEVVIEGQLLSTDLKIGVKTETFFQGDGDFVVRYKLYRTFRSLKISVSVEDEKKKRRNLSGSPGMSSVHLVFNVFLKFIVSFETYH